jgi:ADP-ribose pyrophosphatase YjhB (NUDIX family)
MSLAKNHCAYCGAPFTAPDDPYPRTCGTCKQIHYLNPTPVVIVLVPVEGEGLLVGKRGIEPKKGWWALVSGFMESGETPEETGVRELFEEIGLVAQPEDFVPAGFAKAPELVLIFLKLTRLVTLVELAEFQPNDEVSAVKVLYVPEELAFAAHTEMVKKFFAGYSLTAA